MLALLCLWEQKLGRRLEWVAGHQHQLLKLQQLLDVLRDEEVIDRSEGENFRIFLMKIDTGVSHRKTFFFNL